MHRRNTNYKFRENIERTISRHSWCWRWRCWWQLVNYHRTHKNKQRFNRFGVATVLYLCENLFSRESQPKRVNKKRRETKVSLWANDVENWIIATVQLSTRRGFGSWVRRTVENSSNTRLSRETLSCHPVVCAEEWNLMGSNLHSNAFP